ncbi:MAG TPA: PfkB family carbohydrate kinase [Candidatus Omnitrophota bacterium]|nr:PfkB family carbohydrate kinase [Candidatus Omnitrophota bacterium]
MAGSIEFNPKALIAGRMGIDIVSNSTRANVRMAGGSGLHAALAASLLAPTALVSLTGKDFPSATLEILKNRIDVSGITVDPTRDCNQWVGYYPSLDQAKTSSYAHNIPESSISIPEDLQKSACVFIGAMHPSLQLEILSQLQTPSLVMIDTIRQLIKREPQLVSEAFSKADVVVVNREEAELFAGTTDEYIALDTLLALGPKVAIIKLGSDGAVMASGNLIFRVPAMNQAPVDTTGAGDSFGGAFTGYVAREIARHRVLDNLVFGEAFLMASVMASFKVEGFGSERLISLTPQELFSRFMSSRASLMSQLKLEERGRLNGGVLVNLYNHPDVMSEQTAQKLISPEYFPGSYSFDKATGSLEFTGLDMCLEQKLQAVLRDKRAEADSSVLTRKYGEEIANLDPSRFSYFSLTEGVFVLGRMLHPGDRLDTFSAENEWVHLKAKDAVKKMTGTLSARDWLVTLAGANAIEAYSFKPKYEERVKHFEKVSQDPKSYPLALDASAIFESRVMSKPTSIAYITDNHGEADVDLKFILELARRYESMEGNGEWQIGIIPKATPVGTDATYDSIMACITESDSPVVELQRFIAAGKVKVLEGGSRTQGVNLPHLSQEVGDFLSEVQRANGVVIAKGEANMHTLSGIEIDSFLVYMAKNRDAAMAAGVSLNGLVAAFVPAGIRGVVGMAEEIRQNLADVLAAVQSERFAALVSLDKIRERMRETGELFVDAVNNYTSSEPMLYGNKAATYILPIIEDPKVKGYVPVFIARGSMPFKTAWDTIAQRMTGASQSYPFMPKISVVPKHSPSNLILQMLTPAEAERRISEELYSQLATVFNCLPATVRTEVEAKLGHGFAGIKGKTLKEAVDALASIGLDPRYERAMELFRQLEAEKGKRPQDRDPEIRTRIKAIYGSLKRDSSHTVRPLLNSLLASTEFGKYVAANRLLFIDEAGSTGSTVASAELLVRSFNQAADWKFYTIQPTKDEHEIYDGDCGIKFKPEENQPKLYDMIFVDGVRFTYREARAELSAHLDRGISYKEKMAEYNAAVAEFLRPGLDLLLKGIEHVNSRHAKEVLKMLLRERQAERSDPMARLAGKIAEIVVKEERVPNHTKHRYTIRAELERLEERLADMLEGDREAAAKLAALDSGIAGYDSIQTLSRWQKDFDKYMGDVARGSRSI